MIFSNGEIVVVGGCEFSRTFVYLVGWSWLFWYWLKSWLCCWGGYGSSDGGEIGGDSEVLMISLIKSPNSPKLQPSHQNSNPLTKVLEEHRRDRSRRYEDPLLSHRVMAFNQCTQLHQGSPIGSARVVHV